jgi:hypothetical protein
MRVQAQRLERKLRGGAQAHLFACSDGNWYVTKFRQNPQHRRILVNEWIAAALLKQLAIAAPAAVEVELDEEILARDPSICLQCGSGRIPVLPGTHFGSCYPGSPLTDAVYDYLPDKLVPEVANVSDFRGALVFDKWTCNADSRQAVFFRTRLRDYLGDGPGGGDGSMRKGFVAQMIDHGYIFAGPEWSFLDAPGTGLYLRESVYRGIRTLDDFQPWLERVIHFPEQEIDAAIRGVPRTWREGEEGEISRLLERLYERRALVPDLLAATIASKPQHFVDWKG